MVDAVQQGFEEIQKFINFQNKIVKDIKPVKQELEILTYEESLAKVVRDFVDPKLEKVLYTPNKQAYVEGLHRISDELREFIKDQYTDHPELGERLKESEQVFEEEIDRIVHKNILKEEKRPDGRKLDQVRKINVEVGILPRSHGDGLFNRGSTQALSILTLAAPGFEQWMESMEVELSKKRFMHHYVFPPF